MIDILDVARSGQEASIGCPPDPPVWPAWAVPEGIPPEEIVEGASEEEASGWINAGVFGLKKTGKNAMPRADARQYCAALQMPQ